MREIALNHWLILGIAEIVEPYGCIGVHQYGISTDEVGPRFGGVALCCGGGTQVVPIVMVAQQANIQLVFAEYTILALVVHLACLLAHVLVFGIPKRTPAAVYLGPIDVSFVGAFYLHEDRKSTRLNSSH